MSAQAVQTRSPFLALTVECDAFVDAAAAWRLIIITVIVVMRGWRHTHTCLYPQSPVSLCFLLMHVISVSVNEIVAGATSGLFYPP